MWSQGPVVLLADMASRSPRPPLATAAHGPPPVASGAAVKSFTNRALGVGGDANTTSVTVRLPDEVVAFIDSHFTGRIKNRSEFLQHWAQVGVRVSDDEELSEALDWALERSVQEPRFEIVGEVRMEPEPMQAVFLEPSDIVVGVIPPERPIPDELTTLRESQLEALRSRIR